MALERSIVSGNKKGDSVEIYLDPFYKHWVSEVNNEDITDLYASEPYFIGDSLPYLKATVGIYTVGFMISQICIFRSDKKKDIKLQQNASRFILGKAVGTAGYRLWKTGTILQVLFLMISIIVIGNMWLVGVLFVLSCWTHYIGYYLVYEERHRYVLYNGREVQVQECCGYVWHYALEDIVSINKIGTKNYSIACSDGRSYKITIRSANQEKVLKRIAGDNVIDHFEVMSYESVTKDEMNMLSKMTRGQKEQLIAKKNKRYRRKIYQVATIFYVFLVVMLIVTNIVATGQRALVGYLLWLMIGVYITIVSIIRIKRAKKSYQELLEKDILYACVKNMMFDKVMQFSDEEGKIYQNEFSSKEFERYLKEEQLYILHVPENESWAMEKDL